MFQFRAGVLIFSGVLLAACAQDAAGPATGPVDATAQPVQPAEGAKPAAAAPPPPPARPAGPAPKQERALLNDHDTAAAPHRPVAFPELVGMTEPEIRRELGSPDRIGQRPPAKVWEYAIPGCALSLFIFRDVSGGEAKALAFETTPVTAPEGQAPDPRCAAKDGRASG